MAPTPRNVLLFASLREAAGRDHLEISIDPGTTVAAFLTSLAEAEPTLAPLLPACRVALDQRFARAEEPIGAAKEVALIPPVSGGHDGPAPADAWTPPDDAIRVVDGPIHLSDVIAAVEHPGAGAVVTFSGNVRATSRGQAIVHLDYEAYVPMAESVLRGICTDLVRELPGVRVAVHHRIGHLPVGACAVVIAASSPHRPQAFDACRRAIERLKEDAPIWKKETAEDGATWFGQGP